MKILWLSAISLPAVNKVHGKTDAPTGGWISSMITELRKYDEITSINIVSVHRGKNIEHISTGKVIYTLVPSKNGIFQYDPLLGKQLQKVISDYCPNIIDVQGIEFFLIKSLLTCKVEVPVVATIQGLTSECVRHYNAGIKISEILGSLTLRNFIRYDGLFSGKRQYQRRGENEILSLKQLKYVIGRTGWDKAYALSHNRKLQYFHCGRILRDAFYQYHWKLDDAKRYSIFTTQARYPLKGLHVLLKAISILKAEYPYIKLYIGGKDLLNRDDWLKKISFSDYQKYIKLLITRYDLKEQVVFTGFLNDQEVADRLCKSHVFVIPSFIENSPNALGEAQMIGTPAVASLVGGNADYVKDEETGLLYNCNEPVMLAAKIKRIFDDDKLANYLSISSKKVTSSRHSRKENSTKLLSIYKKIGNYSPP